MNLKEQKKAESKERILKSAADLFREKGYTATGVDELMAEAQLTAGAFYSHFKSKADLFDESIRYMLRTSSIRLIDGLENKTGLDRIEAFMKRYVSEKHRDEPEMGCAIPSVAAEIARHSKNGKAILGQHIEKWITYFSSQLDGPHAREKSMQLICQAIGAVLLSRLVPEDLSKEILKNGQKVR